MNLNLGITDFMPHDRDVDLGFLKLVFSTLPIDLSKIATSSVPSQTVTSLVDLAQTATSPVDLSELPSNLPSESRGGPSFSRMQDAWGCVVIPVVKRRVTVPYQGPGNLSSSPNEFPVISRFFSFEGLAR